MTSRSPVRTGHAVWARRAAALLLLAVVLPAACSDTANEPDAVPENDGIGKITFSTRPHLGDDDPVIAAVEAWNNDPENAEERVDLLYPTVGSDAARSQLVAVAQDAAHGGEDCYDVVTLDVIRTAEFAQFGYIIPLDRDELDIGSHLEKVVETVEFNGATWAVPFIAGVGLLYYRKDLLADPPGTREELVAQAKTIDRPSGMAGYVGQFFPYEGLTVNALELIRDHGGDILAGDAVITDRSAVEAALRELQDGIRGDPPGQWINPDVVEDPDMPESGFRELESRLAFENGEALFLRHWNYAFAELTREGSGLREDQLGVAALPWNSVLGGHNLAVSSCSENQGTARRFIEHMTSSETQTQFFLKRDYAPTRDDVYRELSDDEEHREVIALIRAGIEKAKPRPVSPYYSLVSQVIQDVVTEVLQDKQDKITPEDAVDELERRLAEAREGRIAGTPAGR